MSDTHRFSHHQAEHGEFDPGLRGYFEYRDLGIREASGGDVIAHVIRAREGDNATGEWHCHECTFQMFYVLSGWARFEYEGEGVHLVRPGDCVLQPPGIRHREIEHSADFSVLEIVAPADFSTHSAEASPETAAHTD